MFFSKKVNPYLTPELEQEIEAKGFAVYNYITLKELFMTVQRDYLGILGVINLPFGIVTVILGVLAFLGSAFGLLFGFLFIAYSIIFSILLVKLILRSFYFLQISNVVYTLKGVILGKHLYLYSDTEALDERLKEYEAMFDEFLSKPSRLEQVILQKKEELFEGSKKTGETVFKVLGKMDGEAGGRLLLLSGLSYVVYMVLLYVFYYLGYVFGFVVFYGVSLILKAILYWRENLELQLKKKMEFLDESFGQMNIIESALSSKIGQFEGGEIAPLASFVGNQFSSFYSHVLGVLSQRQKLLDMLHHSNYKDFVDFDLLELYIKNQFNKPLKEMDSLLASFEQKLTKQLSLVTTTLSNQPEYQGNLAQKKLTLSHQLELLQHNRKKVQEVMM